MTSLTATLNKTRLVVTYHNDLIGSGAWRDAIFRVATWSGRHAVLSRADRVLFVSQGHAETSDQRLVYYQRREQSLILPNGVDTDAFIPQPDGVDTRTALHLPVEAQVVGFIGGLDRAHHYKGLNVLLTALATPALAGVHLLVIGDGELKEQYRQQAYQLELGERILFYGAVAQKMLPSFYRACDVIAMPSLAPESFGLVVIEALACGIPVVATDGPGVSTLVEHGHDGLLVEVNNPVALAQALQQLLSDDMARLAMGRRGRAKVEARYGWKQIGEQLEAIYRNVLSFGYHPTWEEGQV